MYREQIKVLDCTIRDGGLINNHYFTDDFVRAVYHALSKGGVDYMEFGYRSSRELLPPEDYGAWKYCDDDNIRRIIDGIESDMKISVMVDSYRVKEQHFAPADESPVDMFRAATYVKYIDSAIELINKCHDLGYETTCNIMAISREIEPDLAEALDQLAKTPVDVVYVVDSFGALYCEQIEYMVKLYKEHLPGKTIGVHCHNNQQLAFSNTIEGIIHNANYVDGSLFGIGRGPGNCCLELLMGFLKNPKFNLTPILKVIQDHMIPMRKEIEWGYILPYFITGILNEHPRSAIAWRKTDDRDKYAEFYEKMRLPQE
ncbi:MAG: nucleoid-structuring protein H-NS [Planctomycetes bacterium RBG_19FT_COMBO_48_8]|nr:MAG: nucleoid-structuring protein H-NS [Planctomycetes bacterium RBG_19FT_COMBO_48_8]